METPIYQTHKYQPLYPDFFWLKFHQLSSTFINFLFHLGVPPKVTDLFPKKSPEIHALPWNPPEAVHQGCPAKAGHSHCSTWLRNSVEMAIEIWVNPMNTRILWYSTLKKDRNIICHSLSRILPLSS